MIISISQGMLPAPGDSLWWTLIKKLPPMSCTCRSSLWSAHRQWQSESGTIFHSCWCVCVAIGRENSVQTTVATLALCVQTRQKISSYSRYRDVGSNICKWLWSSNRIHRLNAHGTTKTSSPSNLLHSGSGVDHSACLFWKPGLHYPDTAQVTSLSYE